MMLLFHLEHSFLPLHLAMFQPTISEAVPPNSHSHLCPWAVFNLCDVFLDIYKPFLKELIAVPTSQFFVCLCETSPPRLEAGGAETACVFPTVASPTLAVSPELSPC